MLHDAIELRFVFRNFKLIFVIKLNLDEIKQLLVSHKSSWY